MHDFNTPPNSYSMTFVAGTGFNTHGHQAETDTSSALDTCPTLALELSAEMAILAASSSLNLSTTIFLVSCW